MRRTCVADLPRADNVVLGYSHSCAQCPEALVQVVRKRIVVIDEVHVHIPIVRKSRRFWLTEYCRSVACGITECSSHPSTPWLVRGRPSARRGCCRVGKSYARSTAPSRKPGGCWSFRSFTPSTIGNLLFIRTPLAQGGETGGQGCQHSPFHRRDAMKNPRKHCIEARKRKRRMRKLRRRLERALQKKVLV